MQKKKKKEKEKKKKRLEKIIQCCQNIKVTNLPPSTALV